MTCMKENYLDANASGAQESLEIIRESSICWQYSRLEAHIRAMQLDSISYCHKKEKMLEVLCMENVLKITDFKIFWVSIFCYDMRKSLPYLALLNI